MEVEKKSPWKWVIDFLKYDLLIYVQKTWTFISDKQKVIFSNIYLLFLLGPSRLKKARRRNRINLEETIMELLSCQE